MELYQQFALWASAHPAWLGVGVMTIAFAESMAMVGLLVPGAIMMFAAGAMIAAGGMSFAEGVTWAAAGAIAGDFFSYWLGRHFRHPLRRHWPFSRYPALFQHGVEFFSRYGGWSVALGRFVGPMRAVIPLVAGVMGMPAWRFALVNLLSGILWAALYLFPGMLFAFSLEMAAEVAWRLATLLLLFVSLLLVTAWAIYRLFMVVQLRANRLVAWLLGWGRRHPPLGRFATALVDPSHPEAGALSLFSTLLLLGAALLFVLVGLIVGASGANAVDLAVVEWLQRARTPWLDAWMVGLTRLGDAPVMLGWALLSCGLLWVVGSRRAAAYWLAAALFGGVAPILLKRVMQVPRPDLVLVPPESYAFPSGHTLMVTVMLGVWALTRPRSPMLSARLAWVVVAVVAVGVGFSRLYLGVHWPSDILGALLLGGVWVFLLGIAYYRHAGASGMGRATGLGLIGGLVLCWLVASGIDEGSSLARYRMATGVMTLPETVWRGQGSERSPSLRAGEVPFEYAGSPAVLERRLNEEGWQRREVPGGKEWVHLISPSLDFAALPPLPKLQGGRPPSLVMTRQVSAERRWVLRLWPLDIRLLPSQQPLWQGALVQQEDRLFLGLMRLPRPLVLEPVRAVARCLHADLQELGDQRKHRVWPLQDGALLWIPAGAGRVLCRLARG